MKTDRECRAGTLTPKQTGEVSKVVLCDVGVFVLMFTSSQGERLKNTCEY